MRKRNALVLSLFIIILLSGSTALKAGWTPDGVPVCTEATGQYNPEILADGAGNRLYY